MPQSATPLPRRARPGARWRKLARVIHLWLGLTAGALFALAGLTGGLIAFGDDIDAWLNRDVRIVAAPPGTTPFWRPLGELYDVARQAMPTGGMPVYLDLPRGPHRAAALIVERMTAASDRMLDASDMPMDVDAIYVDPYRARALGTQVLSRAGHKLAAPLMSILVDLHWRLMLGGVGALVMGISALLLLAAPATGLALWWPRRGKWQAAFRVKRGAGSVRLVYDIHKLAGLAALPVLLVVLFTGACLNLPDQARAVVGLFSPADGWPEGIRSTEGAGTPIGLEAAVAAADALFPDGALMGVSLPEGPSGSYGVRKRAPDEVTRSYPHRQAWVDQYTGRVLVVNDPRRYAAGQRFMEWQYPLHSGEVFGLPGQVVVAVAGVLCPVLYATGLLRWLQKRAARQRAAAHQRARP